MAVPHFGGEETGLHLLIHAVRPVKVSHQAALRLLRALVLQPPPFLGTFHVAWDDGCGLGLVIGQDSFSVSPPPLQAQKCPASSDEAGPNAVCAGTYSLGILNLSCPWTHPPFTDIDSNITTTCHRKLPGSVSRGQPDQAAGNGLG